MARSLSLARTVVAALTLATGCVCGKPHEVGLSPADRDSIAQAVVEQLEARQPQLADLLQEFEQRKKAVEASTYNVNNALLAMKLGTLTFSEFRKVVAEARKLIADLTKTKGAIKALRSAPAEVKDHVDAVVEGLNDLLDHAEAEAAKLKKK